MSPGEIAAASLHDALSDAHHAAVDVAEAARLLATPTNYTVDDFNRLGSDKRLAMDALLHRYNTLVSVLQDRVFRSIAIVEQEDIPESRRSLTDLMEKLGVIGDSDKFREWAVARNKIVHVYTSKVEDQVERLNRALAGAVEIIGFFNETLDYVVRRRLLPIQPLSGLTNVVTDFPNTRSGHP